MAGFALDSTLTTVLLPWGLVFFSGPRPVDVGGSRVEVPVEEITKAVTTDSFCRVASGAEERSIAYTREAYIRDSCIRPLNEPRGNITEAQRLGVLAQDA